jgi:hypothetical protein
MLILDHGRSRQKIKLTGGWERPGITRPWLRASQEPPTIHRENDK